MIRYELSGFDLDTHEYTIRLYFEGKLERDQLLTLPAWIPGSYMIRDFARNITAISASDRNGPLAMSKIDKQSWRLDADVQGLLVEYRVYAFDLSVRSAYLDRTRAYFNGTCLFLRLPGHDHCAWQLDISRPRGAFADGWKVATTLPPLQVDDSGFGSYSGCGYARLIDCPVEIGVFDEREFDVNGVAHRIVLSDGGRFDLDRIANDLRVICGQHVAMFGELPVDRYLFLTLGTADGYGGLEHADSTSLICKRGDLPRHGLQKADKGYRQFLGLCSHEYFHLWNVKRIRPQRLAEADLRCEAYTELLWAFEGITSYYDELALARSGVLSGEDYLDLFATTVTRVLRAPGRLRQSIAESSFDAWTKFYKQDENAPNAIVSYYAKGALVAFGLDVTLRLNSADKCSLDDLMRLLWQRFGRSDIGLPERGIESLVAELLGTRLEEFFQRYVYGTGELPLADWFAQLGVGFRTRAAQQADDLGGYCAAVRLEEWAPAVTLGARFESQPGGLRLTQVFAGGPAQQAGLAPGDLLLSIDRERLAVSNLDDLLRRIRTVPGELHFFRRDRLSSVTLCSGEAPADTCELWLLPDEELAPGVLSRRDAWLQSVVEPLS